MDQVTLVDELKVDGRKLVDQLSQKNFDVTVAFWLKASDETDWFLYIASKVVDEFGRREAYQRLNAAIHDVIPRLLVSLFDVKLIETDSPIAKDVLKVLRQYPGRVPTRYGGPQLGDMSIEEAYIYPPLTIAGASADTR